MILVDYGKKKRTVEETRDLETSGNADNVELKEVAKQKDA